jgi:transcriptional repressor NF-X1
VKNVRCSSDKVSCGQQCGILLGCGYHRCEKSCHPPGMCDPCSQTCGKAKRVCKHPCTSACHAPAKCLESDPCQAIVTQSCACGNLQNRTSCGASTSNPASREVVVLKCNSECMVKQRNARLADALGIKPEGRGEQVWPDDLKAFAISNHAFVKTVESTLRDFFASSRQTMILPHSEWTARLRYPFLTADSVAPIAKRTFVMSLADAYKLVDQEPNRSVLIRRRVDTKIPNPLLSSVTAPPAAGKSLGGLANLRGGAPSSAGSATGSGTWGRGTSSASGWGSARASPAATASTSTAAAHLSGTSTPKSTSRPATPVAPILAQVPADVVAAQAQGKPRGKVGEVEDDDWDKSGDEA